MTNIKNTIKLYLARFSIFLLLFLGLIYFPYLPLTLFNIDINKFSESMRILYNFACDIGFMIIILFLYKEEIFRDFKKYFKNFGANFETSFKYYFIGLIGMILSNLIITFFFQGANANNENTIRSLIDLYPLYMIFSVSIQAPFTEELIFRKSIKDTILANKDNKFTKYLYIILSGFIFAGMHVIGAVSSNLDYLYIIPYLSLGITFGALYYKTDNIFSTISIHALHNTISIILIFIAGV